MNCHVTTVFSLFCKMSAWKRLLVTKWPWIFVHIWDDFFFLGGGGLIYSGSRRFFGAQLTLTTIEVRFSKLGHNSGATFLTQLKRSSCVGFWISTEEVCFCFSFAASLHVSPLTFSLQLTINCEQWSIDEQKQRWGIWSLLPSSTLENLSKTTGPFQTRAENRPRYWALTNSSEIYYLYEMLS